MNQTISEGLARIHVPHAEKISRGLDVFYNPVMKFNRDISVCLLRSVQKKNMIVGDILAASGVRSIRLAKELQKSDIKRIYANDASKKAYESIKVNIGLSGLQDDDRIIITNQEANKFMLNCESMDYIDIDPFGSPNPFLGNAISRIRRGGILAVTATDTGALAGAFVQAGIRKYWAAPLKNDYMHETGLRILARKVQLVAAQSDMAASPILGFYKDHYLRMFLRIESGSKKTDKIIMQHQSIAYCKRCLSSTICAARDFPKICTCGQTDMELAGPLWAGNLGDAQLATDMAKNWDDEKTKKFLVMLCDEYRSGIVGFYDIHSVCKTYGIKDIPRKSSMVDALENAGFKAVTSHISPLGIKTDASQKEIAELFKKLATKSMN